MVIRQLEKAQYDAFCGHLLSKAYAQPLDPSYTVSLLAEGNEYMVKVQPEEGNQIAVLQALLVRREEYGPNFDLITEKKQLGTFLDLLLSQSTVF